MHFFKSQGHEKISQYLGDLNSAQHRVFKASPGEPIDRQSRENDFDNFISTTVQLIDPKAKREIKDMVVKFGILDRSHFACFPPALFYDTATMLLTQMASEMGSIQINDSDRTIDQLQSFLGCPRPCVYLQDETIGKNSDFQNRAKKVKGLKAEFGSEYLTTERTVGSSAANEEPALALSKHS